MVPPPNKPNASILAALMGAVDSSLKPWSKQGILADLLSTPLSDKSHVSKQVSPQQRSLGDSRHLLSSSLDRLYEFDIHAESKPSPAFDFVGLNRFADSLSSSLPTKRNVFYSFHYNDIIRVNNIRHTEQFKAKILEVPQSHYDRSLWETSKRTNPESLKSMIRDGIKNTSVVCVLIGTNTFERPWVRYEIARSVIDQKGLLAVDINSITHHKDRVPHPLGLNPLAFMAVGNTGDGNYRLFEKNRRRINGQWQWIWERYRDHMAAVPLPKYLTPMSPGYVRCLDQGAFRYDAVLHNVWSNLPHWLNAAALAVGRR
jgi:MTH538 TIR-like domain (DUF1863)